MQTWSELREIIDAWIGRYCLFFWNFYDASFSECHIAFSSSGIEGLHASRNERCKKAPKYNIIFFFSLQVYGLLCSPVIVRSHILSDKYLFFLWQWDESTISYCEIHSLDANKVTEPIKTMKSIPCSTYVPLADYIGSFTIELPSCLNERDMGNFRRAPSLSTCRKRLGSCCCSYLSEVV